MKSLCVFAVFCLSSIGQDSKTIHSSRAEIDVVANVNPDSPFWRDAPHTIAVNDNYGNPVPGHRTEIRSRWTQRSLYLLFICPYDQLWLKADPKTDVETNGLWDWDVAEAFIGSDPKNIRSYKEFELSPQGEWLDLDIQLDSKVASAGWNSGFQTAARIDRERKIWYGAMVIPWTAIDTRAPLVGNSLRINLYRQQGPPPHRNEVSWQRTNDVSFHVPASFGNLILTESSASWGSLESGRTRFNVRCAGCHGADGMGGERAPALVKGRRELLSNDTAVREVIAKGLPALGMPAFVLTDSELSQMVTFIRSRVTPLADAPLTGDAHSGEALFFGKAGCSNCHMVKGRGKWIGPDLTEVDRRLTLAEVEATLNEPESRPVNGYRVAKVVLRSGVHIRGFIRNESGFDMQLQALDGKLHLLRTSDIASITRETKSLMPPLRAAAKERSDLLAFLAHISDWSDSASRSEAVIAPASVTWDNIAKPIPGDWPTYNGVLGGNRYSNLTQITSSNVRSLAPKWSFPIGGNALQTTPVVVGGVLYATSVNAVYALDAGSGRQIWSWSRPRTKGLVGDAAGGINRGVAVLGDRVFLATDNAHLVALHRITGGLLWDVEMADSNQHYGATSAPLAVNDLVISGVSGGDEGVRGFLSAYKASTGERVWQFWSIPKPGDPEASTWVGKALEHGCGATWFTGTYDVETGTLFWPIGNPCPDFNGAERLGDNLYTDSVVALDSRTGALKWFYQFTPHDLHDWDATETPMLIDAEYRGQQRKLLLHGNRNGFFYVLDRTNGKLLSASPFVKKLTWASAVGQDGRPILANPKPSISGTEICPSMDGATNWMSPAFSPQTKLFYLSALEKCNVFTTNSEWWKRGESFYGGAAKPVLTETPRKYVRALDLQTGKIVWEYEQVGKAETWGGLLATASGLLFACDDNGYFTALDARSGAPLWHYAANVKWHASPMTYMANGKQFVLVAAGSTILAFALAD